MCINPQGSEGWACGRCPACRINRKRDWVSRMMLEASSSRAAFFVTLTYKEAPVLDGTNIQTLRPSDVQKFFKRFRKNYPAGSLRYFLCGEYGSRTMRPHYHAILFFSDWGLSFEKMFPSVLETSWGHGSVHIGDVTQESLSYTLGYAVKGLTKASFFPDGRHPEFARFSQGLGRSAIAELAHVSEFIPMIYRTNGKDYPVPKYVKKKLEIDYGLVKAPSPLDVQISYLQSMRQSARIVKEDPALLALHEVQKVESDRKALSVLRTKTRHVQRLLERDKNETL